MADAAQATAQSCATHFEASGNDGKITDTAEKSMPNSVKKCAAPLSGQKKSSWIWRKFHRAAPPKFYAVFPCLPYLYHYLAKNSKHFSANSPAAGESRFAAARSAHKSADAPRRIAPPLARLYNRRAAGAAGSLKVGSVRKIRIFFKAPQAIPRAKSPTGKLCRARKPRRVPHLSRSGKTASKARKNPADKFQKLRK